VKQLDLAAAFGADPTGVGASDAAFMEAISFVERSRQQGESSRELLAVGVPPGNCLVAGPIEFGATPVAFDGQCG
jgi:hypothetical protein